MRLPILAAAVAASALALAGCGSASQPVARDAQTGCMAGARALIRTAPASADDPATGPWLGRADHLRDQARKAGGWMSRQLAAELDWAGAQVAMTGFPPLLAMVPVTELCSASDDWENWASASQAFAAAARNWLRASPPPARPGVTAGIVIGHESNVASPCPAVLASDSQPGRGSRAAVGNCDDWTVTLATATGTIRASCGDIAAHAECMSRTERSFDPELGDELYVPDSGQVTRAADITIIRVLPDPWGL
jgi:hypothetical protein